MSPNSIALALATVLLNAGAQLLLRGAAVRGADPFRPATLFTSPLFLLGLVGYGVSVLTWLAVLRKVPLSVAAPCVALVYIVVPVAARLVFADVLNWRMLGGMALVALGVVVVARQ